MLDQVPRVSSMSSEEVAELHSQARSLAIELVTGKGGVGCIDKAIDLDRQALELCPPGHPKRAESLGCLASHLRDRYNQFGNIRDLDETLVLSQETLDLHVKGHPDRPTSLQRLVRCIYARYEQLRDAGDLDTIVVLSREALDLCPKGHPLRPVSLDVLAVCLSTRYQHLGITGDLSEAIVLNREALDLLPRGHGARAGPLTNLAVDLFARYTQLGVKEDLDEAIVLDRETLDLFPKGHQGRLITLNNLSIRLWSRYERLGIIEDLQEAIALGREALELSPQGHPTWSCSLNNLAIRLTTRYNKLGDISDLDEAIVLSREALILFPSGNAYRGKALSTLANHLSFRYKKRKAMEDLDEAILLGRESLDLFQQGDPEGSGQLKNLAGYLCTRFRSLSQPKDKEDLFSLYTKLEDVGAVVSPADLSAARHWIGVAEEFQHSSLLVAYETSLRLLNHHLATFPSLPQHHDILKSLSSSLSVDSFSACLRNHSPAKAVELLEQGRGLFWSQLTPLRSPLDDVIASGTTGKELAAEFTRLASLIRNVFDSPGDQHARLWQLKLKMQSVVSRIRALPGLSRFLLPPSFSDLQLAASGGPVIILNASKYGCDVLIILPERDPVHIPLQITQKNVGELSKELHTLTVRATKADMTKQFAAFLRKLWDQIVLPIVAFLRTTVPTQSRIWWCPTGEFSALPLHAAAPYRKGQQKLSDLYISSYTPTLTTLIRARQHEPSKSAIEKRRFLAVGQGMAAGESELPSVGSELDNIGQLVGNIAVLTRLDGEQSCISKVVEELGQHEWVHLACHGLPNRTRPFESAFALHDGRFTIQRIIGCDLKNHEFAYLSACHTTVGDEQSPDEVIHLASAMQFIGFRSVIGTMWAVDDSETNKITSTFYKCMVDASGRLDHTRAAVALHETMASVRVPLDQRVLYIHFGV